MYIPGKIVHVYSQILLLVATQFMPCSCKIHAMSMSSFVSSCPWTVNVHAFNPLTMACVHMKWGHDFIATKKSSCKIFLKVSLFTYFLPAGMSTPWSMSEWNYHPVAHKLFPQRLVEVDTVVVSVTNESNNLHSTMLLYWLLLCVTLKQDLYKLDETLLLNISKRNDMYHEKWHNSRHFIKCRT